MTLLFKSDPLLLIAGYQKKIEEEIRLALDKMGQKNELRDACEYALTNGGKRFRPMLLTMIADAIGHGLDVSQAALAAEFFHTASLVADDLPCMDNDDERRDKPSLHRVYGEATALLVTYCLIAAGYQCLVNNGAILKQSPSFAGKSDHISLLAVENVAQNAGIHGAAAGQFLDLYPPDLQLSTLCEVIRKKTITLFEISFVLGWLFGGGAIEKIELLKKTSSHFGMAFQIADDLEDMAQDKKNKHALNLASLLGKEMAMQLFYQEIDLFLASLKTLHIDSDELLAVSSLLTQKASNSFYLY